ncbi:MAG TPA: hypothetical protein PKW37_06760 [Salinivirgaceae bacterium]|nr:hypothetical protein [Salinivirgaceae bacterium]
MLTIQTLLAALILTGIAVAGLAIRIIVIKGGRFPDTHVGHNKEMRKKGIVCAKAFDKMEQKKAKSPVDYTTLKIDKSV